jgi:hypothetical protein
LQKAPVQIQKAPAQQLRQTAPKAPVKIERQKAEPKAKHDPAISAKEAAVK